MVVTTGRTTSRDTNNVYAAAHLYIQFRATVGKLRSEATPRCLKAGSDDRHNANLSHGAEPLSNAHLSASRNTLAFRESTARGQTVE